MKKLIPILVIVLSIVTFNVLAQSPFLWEQYCPGGVTQVIQGAGVLVQCAPALPTATSTLLPPTATLSPPTATTTPVPLTPTSIPTTIAPSNKIVDHTRVDLFNQIPASYLTAAGDLKMAFMNRSVGSNISSGLDCLASATWGESAQYCRVAYTSAGMTTSKTYLSRDLPNVPSEIMFTGGLSRANWTYDNLYQGTWDDMTRDFINIKFPLYASYDVVGFQFSYLNVLTGANIDEKFFNRTYSGWNIVDLEALIVANPGKTFLFWTTSLSREIGTPDATSLNQQYRQYMSTSFAQQHNIWLIDIADIESYDMAGNPCLLNGYPIICRDYTTETQGGHLGSISTGMIRTGQAVWVTMAQIAGWRP
jgi:hypothetical protein